MKPVVCLDMDGVLVDFNAGIPREPDMINEVGVPWFSDPHEMYAKDFFANLPVLDPAINAVKRLLTEYDIDLHIASKPIPNEFCASEKCLWVQKHLPDLIKKTHLLQDKALLNADFLIDDDMRWKGKFKGTFLHFNTNNPYDSWNAVFAALEPYKKNGNP